MIEAARPFSPDWVSAPGDTIADILEERDWTQAQLADRLGFTTKHVSLLVNGKATIGEETAIKLSRVLGSTPSFWLRREADYRAALSQLDETRKLQQWVPWLQEIPVKELVERGAIAKSDGTQGGRVLLVKKLLVFFGVASPEEWRTCYASSDVCFRRDTRSENNAGAISAWLRLGEIEAQNRECAKFHKQAFVRAIEEIRLHLTVLPSEQIEPELLRLCARSGVALVLTPSIKGAKVSGAARWLNPHKAVIQLSLYGKTNDRFWFNFFHEAAHIILHDNKKDIFLDEWSESKATGADVEKEANDWASEVLIPKKWDGELKSIRSKEKAMAFAERLNLHPGIVVGRLQHDKIIPMNWMNDLKSFVQS